MPASMVRETPVATSEYCSDWKPGPLHLLLVGVVTDWAGVSMWAEVLHAWHATVLELTTQHDEVAAVYQDQPCD